MHQHIRALPAWLLGLTFLATSAAAAADPAERFVHAKGFRTVDTQKLVGSSYYTMARFPKMGTSVFNPDAYLPAPVRALLLLDSHEGTLPHVRYLVNYQPTSEPSSPDDQHDFIDITRFNLGPAMHADLVDSVPAEYLADVNVFGVGPHVRWRFAMSSIQGMSAGLDAVSRKVVSAKEAAALDCLGQPCMQLEAAEGPKGHWKPEELATPTTSFQRFTQQGPAPASVIEQLLALLGEDAQRAIPFAPNANRKRPANPSIHSAVVR